MEGLKYFITSKAKRNLLKFFLSDIEASYYTREVARLTGEPLNAVRRELGYLEKAGLLSSRMQGNLKYYEVVKTYPLLAEWRKIVMESYPNVIASEARQSPPQNGVIPGDLPVVIASGEAVRQSQGRHETAKTEALKHDPIDDGELPIVPDAEVIASHETPVIARSEATRQSPAQHETTPHTVLTLDSIISRLQESFEANPLVILAIIHGAAALTDQVPGAGIDLLVVGDIGKDSLMEAIAAIEDASGASIILSHMSRSDFDYRNAQGDPFVRRIWGEKKLVVKGRH